MTTLTEIERVLDRKVRPYLRTHGGEIISLSFENGVYRFRFLGQCSNCPSAYLTAEAVVGENLQEELPNVTEVLMIRDVSGELISQARNILNHR